MAFLNFFQPKWKHTDYRTRMRAVAKMTNGSKLAKVALTSSDHRIRQEAVKKISDEKVLLNVARSDEYLINIHPDWLIFKYPVRELAIGKLNNKNSLHKFAKNKTESIREAAQKRICELEGKKYEAPQKETRDYDDYYDARQDMDQHQSPFGFKR